MSDRAQPDRDHPRPIAAGLYGDLSATLAALGETTHAGGVGHDDWVADLRAAETTARDREHADLADDRSPSHPMRVYAELAPLLERDAIIVVDAGDFGSYAGRVIDSYVPGAWLTAAHSVASVRVPAMRWPPNWPGPTVRSSCCKATAPSDSAAWNGTRWSGTTCRWCR